MQRPTSAIACHGLPQLSRLLALICACALWLSACGGGGGGDEKPPPAEAPATSAPSTPPQAVPPNSASPNSVPPTPAMGVEPGAPGHRFAHMPAPANAPAGLFISEVAAPTPDHAASWLEIFNHTGQTIDLAQYQLRSAALDASTATDPAARAVHASALFALPSVHLPHNSYLVIGARTSADLHDGPAHLHLSNDQQQTPHWQAHDGYVELQQQGRTVDFVRFGSSLAQPATPGAWVGVAAPAIRSGSGHLGALVRSFFRFRQTHTASDWSLVNFPTPGGINDVLPGVIDSDNDGIPDSAKQPGGSYAGLDLYAMGARRGQRELFIQIDYQHSSDPAVRPDPRALEKIQQAFARQRIAVHFDVGNLLSAGFDPAQHNLSGDISHQRGSQRCTQLRPVSLLQAGCSSVYATKAAHMDVRRKPFFRYLLMGHSQQPSGQPGTSGAAELIGDDFLVTLGGWALPAGSWHLANYQAATIMHELGHTLGLRHGGGDDEPNKPNYFSIMNYFYQTSGLPSLTGSSLTQRYYYWLTQYQNRSVPGYSAAQPFPVNALDDGPLSASFRIDYSDGSSQPLDENWLDESSLLGRSRSVHGFVDWNINGAHDVLRYGWDLNQSGTRTVLRDHNDWARLVINPRQHGNTTASGIAQPGGGFDALSTPFQPLQTEELHPPGAPAASQAS